MYKIIIDATIKSDTKVSLVKIEGGKENPLSEKKGDIDVVVAIQELLSENNLPLVDVASLVSNPGPGSFTGLKIGSTVANVLNWALGRKKISELEFPDYGREPNITLKNF